MIAIENVNTFVTGVFPDTVADNSTGASTADGFEFIAEYINNSIIGDQQDWMDYAGLTPDGVTEAAGVSQIREAIQKGNAVGPGYSSVRFIEDIPSVHGDRVLILSEQGVLVASYPELDAATWVGGAGTDNQDRYDAGGKFYRSSDAGGATPNIAGPYLQLPAQNPTFLKKYNGDTSGADFVISGSPSITSVSFCQAIPFKTSAGDWYLILAANVSFGTSNRTSSDLTIAGVSITATQSFSSGPGGSIALATHTATGTLVSARYAASSTTSGIPFNALLKLDSKPTWADDFIYEWGITY